MKRLFFLGTAVASLLVGVAIGRFTTERRSAVASEDRGRPVATFSEGAITDSDLRGAADAMGPSGRARLSTPQSRRQLAVDLIRRRMLADDARRKGLDAGPVVQSRVEQLLADEEVKRTVDQALAPPTDADIAAYLEQHRGEYARPERTRLAVIFVSADASAPERARKEKEARELLEDVRKKSAHDFYAFSTAARAKSDDAQSRPYGGELPPMTNAELSARIPPEVVEALASLKTPHQLLDKVVVTEKGFFLVQLLAREPALNPTLAELKDVLRPRVAAEKRQAAYEKLMADVDARAHVEIDEAALASMHP